MAQKFKPGDKVRIIGYGHPYWTTKEMWYAEEQFRVEWNTHSLRLFWPEAPNGIPREHPDNILKEDGDQWTLDMLPQIVGKEGIIIGSYADQRDAGVYGFAGGSRETNPDSEHTYSVSGIPEKNSWYDEAQLELIETH